MVPAANDSPRDRVEIMEDTGPSATQVFLDQVKTLESNESSFKNVDLGHLEYLGRMLCEHAQEELETIKGEGKSARLKMALGVITSVPVGGGLALVGLVKATFPVLTAILGAAAVYTLIQSYRGFAGNNASSKAANEVSRHIDELQKAHNIVRDACAKRNIEPLS